jgi:hypothetical protein
MADAILSAERLRDLLHYDPETGVFTWREWRGGPAKAGQTAGTKSNGYVILSVDHSRYRANRLAFLYMTGEWPKGVVDHINGVRDDDRWINLRDVPFRWNIQNVSRARSNSSSGALGVWKRNGMFIACIRVDGRRFHLGTFSTLEMASDAYLIGKTALHDGALTGLNRDECQVALKKIISDRNVAARVDSGTGLRGVRKFGANFQSRIQVRGRAIHLGTFPTIEAARAAYLTAKQALC